MQCAVLVRRSHTPVAATSLQHRMRAMLMLTRSLPSVSVRFAATSSSSSVRPFLPHRLPDTRLHQARHMAKAADAAVGTSGSSSNKDDVQGAMLDPSPANNLWVRGAAVAAAVAATAGTTTVLSSQGAAFVHLASYSILLGTNIWNSFFVGLTMFKNMPRQMFGRVQAKLFPQYFSLTTGAACVLLGTLVMGGAPLTSQPAITLSVAAGANILNWLFIEPKTTALMFERYAIENKETKTEADQAEIKRLYGQFGKWHGISSVNNLAVLVATFAYGWTLAGRLAL